MDYKMCKFRGGQGNALSGKLCRYPLWMVPIVSPVDKLQFEVFFVVEGVHVVHLEDVEVMEVSREID